jgi:CHAD domain-containing protein
MRHGRPLPDASDSVHSAVRKVLARELARMVEHEPGTRAGVDPEALHRMRVASRRARATLGLLQAGVPARTRKRLGTELRWLGGCLGEVRDLDVQLDGLAASMQRLDAAQQQALQPYRAHLVETREARREAMLGALDSERYVQLLAALEAFVNASTGRGRTPAAREPIGAAGAVLVRERVSKLRKRGRALAARRRAPADEELHALRIRAKRVRYTLEFLSGMTGKPGARSIKRFVALQDLLGGHQDAVVAVERIERYLREQTPDAATARVLRTFTARERRRAKRARARFASVWRKLEDASMRDDMRKVLRRLRRAERAAPPRAGEEKSQ